ncbi:DNA ligase [Rhodobacter phage RcCWillis]|nr:DNA ligase [Rhodobacter phage RcCWillis]
MSNFKPLLAHTVESMDSVQFPVMAAPKLDGIRCLIVNGEAVTRSLKPVPNAYVRDRLRGLPDYDGELIVGRVNAPDVFNVSTSGIMSRDGEPEFTFHVFDVHSMAAPFEARYLEIDPFISRHVALVGHDLLHTVEELSEFEARCIADGFEGVMIRDPRGAYKNGRSTVRDRILGKVKRFADTEATIIGVEELMRNGNEQTRNALGHAERSTAQAGLVPADTLGALIVQSPEWEAPFKIGTGYDSAMRAALWADRDNLAGRLVKFKHQPSGAKDAPRFPVFIGFRGDE